MRLSPRHLLPENIMHSKRVWCSMMNKQHFCTGLIEHSQCRERSRKELYLLQEKLFWSCSAPTTLLLFRPNVRDFGHLDIPAQRRRHY